MLIRSCSASRSVYVVLTSARHLVVNHMLHIRYVQATSSHVSGYQQTCRAVTESLQVLQTLLLDHVGMQGQGIAVQQAEERGQSFYAIDGIAKNNGASWMALNKVVKMIVLVIDGTQQTALGQCLCGFCKWTL